MASSVLATPTGRVILRGFTGFVRHGEQNPQSSALIEWRRAVCYRAKSLQAETGVDETTEGHQRFPMKKQLVRWTGLALVCVAGCISAPVTFQAPTGTVMFVDGKPYHLPTEVEFHRPSDVGESNKYQIRLIFSTPQGEVHAKGQAVVFGYTASDLDKLVKNSCQFSDAELAKLAAGTTIVYKVQTASRQPMMELTLVKE
jgi:hypothetical protein